MPAATKKKTTEQPERRREEKGPISRVGNLTKDPELLVAESGNAWCKLGIAVNTPKKPGDWAGERDTTFYDVVCFKSLAENVAESLSKGDRVVVSGRAELEHWTDKEGAEQTSKRIVAEGIGPDLRFATVAVQRTKHSGPSEDQSETDDF